MKVHNKGQIVIPAHVRRQLGIDIGDELEVEVDPDGGTIELRRPPGVTAESLAGSLKQYARNRSFPSRVEMDEALRKGLAGDG